jgi:hypothetical protein
MSLILGGLILLFNLIVCIKNIQNGFVVYIILILIGPVTHFGDYTIDYEILAFVPIFSVFIYKTLKGNNLYISSIHLLVYLYIGLLILSTVVAANLYNVNILWITLLGNVRFAVLLFMLTQIFIRSEDYFKRILIFVISINLVLVLVQIIFPGSVSIFYELYYKEGLLPLQHFLEIGRFTRATGSFGSPVNLGALSLISFSYFYAEILKSNRKKTIIFGICASLVTGAASLTKTFILGVPLVILSGLIIRLAFLKERQLKINPKKILTAIPILLFVFLASYIVIQSAIKQGFFVAYYFSYLFNPLEAFVSRFDIDEGNLRTTIDVIKNNPVVGVGITRPMNEFTGDSSYLLILHDTGLLGTLLFFTLFLVLILTHIKTKNICGIMVIISLLITGVSSSTFIGIFGILVIVYSISLTKGILYFKKKYKYYDIITRE